MVFRQERHIFIATFLILLMGFFSTTSSLQTSLSVESATSSPISTEEPSLSSPPEDSSLLTPTGLAVTDATSSTDPLGDLIDIREEFEYLGNAKKCPERVALFSRLVESYINFEKTTIYVAWGEYNSPSRGGYIEEQYFLLMKEMIQMYFSLCMDDPNGYNPLSEPYERALKQFKRINYDRKDQFPRLVNNPFSKSPENVNLDLDTCFTPVTHVPLPVDHVGEILYGLGIFAASVLTGGLVVLSIRTLGCVGTAVSTGGRIISIYSRTAPIIPIASVSTRTAILTTSTLAAVTPNIASAVARGVAASTVVLAIGIATDQLNAQNTGNLKTLSEDQVNAVIDGLTPADNARYANEALRACLNMYLRPCPKTGGLIPEGIVNDKKENPFTPTGPITACRDNTLPAIPTIKGFSTGNRNIGKVYMDVSPDFSGQPGPVGPPAPGDNVGLQAAAFMDELGQDVSNLVQYYVNSVKEGQDDEVLFDFTNFCQQYPPGSVITGAFRFKFMGKCGPKYMDMAFSYNCGTRATRLEGAPITGGSRPSTSLFQWLLRLLQQRSQSSKPAPITPGGTPSTCSGNACVTAGNPPCPAGQYCTAACVCQPNVCGDGVKGQGEACDPGVNPSGCLATETCTNIANTCTCVPLRRKGGITGAAVTNILTTEQWTFRSGTPTDSVTMTYFNNLGKTAQGTFKRAPFEPLVITLDGVTTTYTHDANNKLQSLSDTKGFQETYMYDSTGKLSQINSQYPGLRANKMIFTPFDLPEDDIYNDRYVGVRVHETLPFLQHSFLRAIFLRSKNSSPLSSDLPPYSTYVITHTISADRTTDIFTVVTDPNEQRYTTSTTNVYTTDSKLQSTTYTVDYNGDGTAERTLIYTYHYDTYGRRSSVTDNTGRIYTYYYSPMTLGVRDAWKLTYLLSIKDNEGDDVTVRPNGVAVYL
ncbi:MAG: hypothetical protein Q8L34_01865 [Candidatus Woesearchaeota archaeon]|nr:hypothetical protein [Candidatus Woesearchaeota archaeon]